MPKNVLTAFDFAAAFRAMDDIEYEQPAVVKAKTKVLAEDLSTGAGFNKLFEDYFDVENPSDLDDAAAAREDEIKAAKMDRIEKIVDLDAKTIDEIKPSYVGKYIIQCPQCMTLFYKDEADIEKDPEDETMCNINEPCQHCGNISGYEIKGKVDAVEPEPAEETTDDNELDLDFDTETPAEEGAEETEENTEESTEEAATEDEDNLDDLDLDLDLDLDEEEPEEKAEESFNTPTGMHLNENLNEDDTEDVELDVEADESLKKPYRAELNDNAYSEHEAKLDESCDESKEDCVDCEKEETDESMKAPFRADKNEGAYSENEPTLNESVEDDDLDDLIGDIKPMNECGDNIQECGNNIQECGDTECADQEQMVESTDLNEDAVGSILASIDSKISSIISKALAKSHKANDVAAEEMDEEWKRQYKLYVTYADGSEKEIKLCDTFNNVKEEVKRLVDVEGAIQVYGDRKDGDKYVPDDKLTYPDDLDEELDEAVAITIGVDEIEDKVMAEQPADAMVVSDKDLGTEVMVHDWPEAETDEVEDIIPAAEMEAHAIVEPVEEVVEETPVDDEIIINEIEADEAAEEAEEAEAEAEVEAEVEQAYEDEVDESMKAPYRAEQNANAYSENEATLNEAVEDISDEEFEELINDPIYNDGTEDPEVEEAEEIIENTDEVTEDDYDYSDVEEVDEESLGDLIGESLTETYENIKSYSVKDVTLDNGTLIVEGIIKFESGNENKISYKFTEATKNNAGLIRLVGTNKTLSNDGKFIIEAKNNNGKIVVESMKYSYTDRSTNKLVEGKTSK